MKIYENVYFYSLMNNKMWFLDINLNHGLIEIAQS